MASSKKGSAAQDGATQRQRKIIIVEKDVEKVARSARQLGAKIDHVLPTIGQIVGSFSAEELRQLAAENTDENITIEDESTNYPM